MKKALALTFGLLLVATMVSAGIGSSKHDFSGTSWTSEICVACHTPHDGNITFAAPLWNHNITSATFTFYTSGTMNASRPTSAGDVSKACLSCHDGTVNLDAFGGSSGGTAISGAALVDTDLTNDHPISIVYSEAAVDTEIHASSADWSAGGTVASYLFGGNVECASCHDVHNGTSFAKLLTDDTVGSTICLNCHNK